MNAYEVRQAWCLLQVKLCDPCLSALKWSVYHARRYTSALLLPFTFIKVNEAAMVENSHRAIVSLLVNNEFTAHWCINLGDSNHDGAPVNVAVSSRQDISLTSATTIHNIRLTLNIERNRFAAFMFDLTPVDGATARYVLLIGLCVRSSYDYPANMSYN